MTMSKGFSWSFQEHAHIRTQIMHEAFGVSTGGRFLAQVLSEKRHHMYMHAAPSLYRNASTKKAVYEDLVVSHSSCADLTSQYVLHPLHLLVRYAISHLPKG